MRARAFVRTALPAIVALASARASAQENGQPAQPPPPVVSPMTPPVDELVWSDRFVLDTARYAPPPPDPNALRVEIHGEYQIRGRFATDLPLTAPVRDAPSDRLGQNSSAYHWLRLGLRFQVRDKLAVFAQGDFPSGFVFGDTTKLVTAARDSYAEAKWYEFRGRQLYLELATPVGLVRVGQQASHWGMGLVANDGDHPSIFGDYRRGTLVERLLFATQPFGRGTPFTLALAGDVVFQDATVDLTNGDHAVQGVAALLLRGKDAEVGLYGVYRHQWRSKQATDALTPFDEKLDVGVLDVAGKVHGQIPGGRGFAYAEMEAASIFGSTNFLRGAYQQAIDPTAALPYEKIRSFGAAAKLGMVHVAGDGKKKWGDATAEVEVGYTTGDADPSDGTQKRFTFEANHKVGLVLFDQVMRWKTARAATLAQDAGLVQRAAPGVDLLPSEGAVFGATYVNPRFIARPRNWLDLKAGAVVAQATSDFVDPYRFGLGNATNYDGGDARHHDLGLELDLGADVRIPFDQGTTVQLGAEGGVLFPGHAFDDAQGNRLPTQGLLNVKAGFQY